MTTLWSDDDIITRYHDAFGANPDPGHYALLCWMRDDWAAERAALTKRIESLEAQLDIAKAQVRAALREAGQKSP